VPVDKDIYFFCRKNNYAPFAVNNQIAAVTAFAAITEG
jgi:hypothetical protein